MKYKMSLVLSITTVIVTLNSPVITIQVQKFIVRYTDKKTLKIDIFKQLMATKSQNARLSNEHVRALNIIDITFYGRVSKGQAKRSKTENQVISSLKLHFSHLNTTYPNNDNASGLIWSQNSNNLFVTFFQLLQKILVMILSVFSYKLLSTRQ